MRALMTAQLISSAIRTIPDHPKPGILFRDVTTLLGHAEAFRAAIDATGPAGVDAETAAIEAGAQDLEAGEEGVTHFYTAPSDLDAVRKALEAAGWKVKTAALAWRAKNPVAVAPEHMKDVEKFLGELDEDDDVHEIFVGMK